MAPIREVDRNSLITHDGTRHEVETIIYATGFDASQFLADITVSGRRGRLLHEQWEKGASAWHGLAISGFPNAFLIAGPNSFTSAGSNPAMKEIQIDYIMRCLRWRDEIGAAGVDLDSAAMSRHRRWMLSAIGETVWPDGPSSWYKHRSGAVTNPWPFSVRRYARALSHIPPSRVFIPLTTDYADELLPHLPSWSTT